MLHNNSPFEQSTHSGQPARSADGAARATAPMQLAGTKFTFKRKVLKLIGAAFSVYDQNENLVLFANQKGFKLKEDIRVYTGEDKSVEVLRIAARSIMDFSAAYDVFDSATGKKSGLCDVRA